jgi:hypothetical protein
MSAARHTRGPRQARLDLLNANARKVLAAMLGGASLRLDPEWPELGFWDLIKIAFRDHLIDRIDHPVVKRLRGQA